ncbi:MAG TPA: HNH endonuclease family protein, partial [Hyphomicrobiaceae bacterium]|nr:HNH endonuclease family protein [Hyphomicrobiaceae bacterium]
KTPATKSRWLTHFPNAAVRAELLDSLGNLVPLTETENQGAGNDDFDRKKAIYSASVYRMTREAGAEPGWTPAIVRARTERLVAALSRSLELG